MARFLVIGLGRFGASLAETLNDNGCEVIAVDRNMDNVAAIKDRVAYAMQLDASDTEALRSLEVTTCTAAIVSMGEDFESSVECVAALKEAGVAKVIARARTARQGRILLAVGASQVLELEGEMGRRLGLSLASEK